MVENIDPLQALRCLLREGDEAPKGYLRGCHRTVSPAVTVARARSLMAAMGITRIADVTGLDRIGIPVVMVCRPNSRSVAVSQGKGMDRDAAVASGLMEAVEAFHAEHIELPLKYATHAEMLCGHCVADIERLPRVADGKFSPDASMLWVEGWDLLGGSPCWLPYETVSANFTLPLPPGSGCFDASTNGLASGNHLLEALCHGICEVVERDATALWHRRSDSARIASRVDPSTVDDAGCRDAIDRLAHADFAVSIWETTSDVAVPAFLCLITDSRDASGHLGMGAGAHAAPEIALLRAITEAVQVRTTYISGARDDLELFEYSPRGREQKLGTAKRMVADTGAPRDFAGIAGFASPCFSADLDGLLSRLRSAGVDEVVAVDLSRDAFGIPVVRVCIPGLEGPDDHDGYVPGERARRASGQVPA